MQTVFITEIFKSFQGESTLTGRLSSFIRFSTCNLRCSLCDTKYSWEKAHTLSFKELDKILDKLNTPYWCITGGEPLLQKDALTYIINKAKQNKVISSVETNGSLPIIPKLDTKWIVDVKTPSTRELGSFNLINLELMTQKDELKFLISDEHDFNFAKDFILKHQILKRDFTILFSPNLERKFQNTLIKHLLSWGVDIVFQPQLHKLIPEKPIYLLKRS